MMEAYTRLASRTLLLVAVALLYLSRAEDRPPVFREHLSPSRIGYENRKHKFICKTKGRPKPVLTWYHNNESLKQTERITFKKYSLTISNLRLSDSGSYSCKAKNSVGEIWGNFTLTVVQKTNDKMKALDVDGDKEEDKDPFADLRRAPEFYKKLNLVGYLARAATATVIFDCEANGHPNPTITWQRNGIKLTEKSNNRILQVYDDDIDVLTAHACDIPVLPYELYDFKLKITQLSLEDKGNYTCIVQNEIGSINFTTKLEVQRRVAIAPLMEDVQNQTTLVGENVTFTCKIIMSDSQPILQWLRHYKKNDSFVNEKGEPYVKVLQKSGFFESTIDDPQNLVLLNVSKEDEGWYTCLVANTIGMNYKSAYLSVLNDPDQRETTPNNNVVSDKVKMNHG